MDEERKLAYNLLDLLTRSGSLPIHETFVHVIVASSFSFQDSVMNTLVIRNENPIEAVEKCSLVVASVVYGVPLHELVVPEKLSGVLEFNPSLKHLQN